MKEIIIDGLHFSYGKSAIFDNCSIRMNAKFNILTGPPGCGKTTLLKIISQNINREYTAKEVTSFEKPILILQEDALLPWLSGIENITKILLIRENEIREKPFFSKVEEFIYKKAYEMSYGQRRVVELIRAILASPDLLCLDEPFNFLDNKSKNLIIDLLKNNSKDMKIIMSTHNIENCKQLPGFKKYVFDGATPVSKLKIK